MFLDLGSQVAVWDKDSNRLHLDHLASNVFPFEVDITDYQSTKTCFVETTKVLGGLDILVNCAGIAKSQSLAEITPHDWSQVMAVNLNAAFFVSQLAVPILKTAGGGSIINIGSISGLRGELNFAHYSASKFALIGLTQSMAKEFGKDQIRVNCVCPGALDSPMNDLVLKRKQRLEYVSRETAIEQLLAATPLGRFCTPTDIANAVCFLSSELASFITGEVLAVTGGLN
jgi:NAD(P)-dependent dehydrogenase (short-subunit alcohol dehydrogenase family)